MKRVGLRIGYQFEADSRKVKFLVNNADGLPDDEAFGSFTDFEVEHHYLRVRDFNLLF